MVNATVKKDNKIIYLSIFLYFLMFFSNDTYLFGTNANSMFVSLARYYMILCCFILVVFFGSAEKLIKDNKKLLYYLAFCLVFLVVCYLNNDLLNYIIIKLLCFTIGYLISCKFSLKQFAVAFVNVISFIVICALGMVFIAYISPNIVRMFPKITNTAEVGIHTVLFAGMDERMLDIPFKRINGIFWEPGVFQIYINLALIFQLFFMKKISRRKTVILLLGLFFTFSTTGIIVIAWLAIIYLISDKKRLTKLKKNLLPVTAGIAIVGILLFAFDSEHMLWNMFFEKFKTMNTTNGTAMVRKAGIITNIEIALANPIHGIGIQNMKQEFLIRTAASPYLAFWTHQNTNTLLAQYSTHGILFGLLFTLGTYRFCKLFSNRRIIYVAIFIAIAMLYMGENLQYSTLPFIIVFFGFGYRKRSRGVLVKKYQTNRVVYENSVN